MLKRLATSLATRVQQAVGPDDPYLYFSMLWRGHSRFAQTWLWRHLRNPLAGRWARAECGWILAQYYCAHGDHARACSAVEQALAVCPELVSQARFRMGVPYILDRAGHSERAEAFVREQLRGADADPDMLLLLSALDLERPCGRSRQDWINAVFEKAGLEGLSKIDSGAGLALANIEAAGAAPIDRDGAPLISVIMPVHNAGNTLEYAVNSLRRQSWTNLEIIIVDDCSTDGTPQIAARLAAMDDRISVHRTPSQSGAYGARNAALRLIRGEYFTTHDGDDWSHPRKLELQMDCLRQAGSLASWSPWVRCDETLRLQFSFMPQESLLLPNYSSLLYHRSVVETNGFWDEARVEGDNEYMSRLKARRGDSALASVDIAAPLSFALRHQASLTSQSDTHIFTHFYGLRRSYKELCAYLHAHRLDAVASAQLMPSHLLSAIAAGEQREDELDVLLVCPLSQGLRAADAQLLDQLISAGWRTGVFNYPGRQASDADPVDERVLEQVAAGQCKLIAPGQSVRAAHIVVAPGHHYPRQIDRPPVIKGSSLALCPQGAADRPHLRTVLGLPVKTVNGFVGLERHIARNAAVHGDAGS